MLTRLDARFNLAHYHGLIAMYWYLIINWQTHMVQWNCTQYGTVYTTCMLEDGTCTCTCTCTYTDAYAQSSSIHTHIHKSTPDQPATCLE